MIGGLIFCWSLVFAGMFVVAAAFEVAGERPVHTISARRLGWLALVAVVFGAYLLGGAR